jgi:putative transposase
MARALRLQFKDATYHICARGNRRDVIFSDDKDRFRFLELMEQSLRRYQVELHAYVLLPNHFHFLAQTRRANLSRWMHWLIASYSIWFNRRHRSNGHLFQGRYKSFLVQGGRYLLGLSRYIHLNPVRGRVLGAGNPTVRRARLRAYRWSSYRGYAGLARQDEFVIEELVLGELGGRRRDESKLRYRRFVEAGLVREIENPFEAVRWQAALGDESFVQRLKDRLKAHGEKRGEITAVRRAHRWAEPRAVIARVAAHHGLAARELLQERHYGSQAHNVAMWLLRQRGVTLREIGTLFGGMNYPAVSQRVRRVEKSITGDKRLRRLCQLLNV